MNCLLGGITQHFSEKLGQAIRLARLDQHVAHQKLHGRHLVQKGQIEARVLRERDGGHVDRKARDEQPFRGSRLHSGEVEGQVFEPSFHGVSRAALDMSKHISKIARRASKLAK